jgi:hypothetical protein
MSGKRHHFIPKFLQRGFVIDADKKTQKIWVYQKGHSTYPANIIDAGVESYFYGIDGDNSLDDEITKFEDKYALAIHSARISELNVKLDKKVFSKLIFNFEIRTRNLRENFRESFQIVIHEVLHRLNNFHEYEDLLHEVIDEEINKLVDQECDKHGVPRALMPLYRARFKSESKPLIELQTPVIREQIQANLDSFKSILNNSLVDNVKHAHIQAMLKASTKISPKLKWYEQLEYSIFESSEEEAVLGDSIILFHVSGEREYKSFLDDRKSLLAVILPISPKRIICGSRNKNYIPDFTAIKQATIASSKKFFLFNKHDEHMETLKETIAANSYILSLEEIKGILLKVP